MDQRNFPYSMKNTSVPSKKLYLKILIGKVELLIKRMRWKALFFENESESTLKYGFNDEQYQQKLKHSYNFDKINIKKYIFVNKNYIFGLHM